jgi:hypothetical protein
MGEKEDILESIDAGDKHLLVKTLPDKVRIWVFTKEGKMIGDIRTTFDRDTAILFATSIAVEFPK